MQYILSLIHIFAPVEVAGSELLPGQLSRQPVQMEPLTPEVPYEDVVIPAHTLFAEYPEKIPEDEIKPCLLYTSANDRLRAE